MAMLKATGDTAARPRLCPVRVRKGQRDGGLRNVLGDRRRRSDRGGERLAVREEKEQAAATGRGGSPDSNNPIPKP